MHSPSLILARPETRPLVTNAPDWAAELQPFIRLEWVEQGIFLMKFAGQLGPEQIDQIRHTASRMTAWTQHEKKYFYVIVDATAIEIKDLATRYTLLRSLRWESNPYNLKTEFISATPFLNALAKMLLRFNPSAPYRIHKHFENALNVVRQELKREQDALAHFTADEMVLRPEFSHVSVDGRCRMEFFTLREQIVYIRLTGAIRMESAHHLVDAQHQLCAELKQHRERLYSIGEIFNPSHDQPGGQAMKLLQQRLATESLPYEKSYTIMPPSMRGMMRLLQRLAPAQMAHVELSDSLTAALDAINQHENLLGIPLDAHSSLPTNIRELQQLVKRQQQELTRMNSRKDSQLERLEEIVSNMVLNSEFTPLVPESVPSSHPLAQLTDLAYVLQYDLRSLIDTLRQEISEREAAQLTAALASESKSRFLATVSHEIRAPLNAVLGFAALLMNKGEALPAEQRQMYLSRIQQNGMHLLGLLNDILDLSRIDAGELQLKVEEIDAAEILHLAASQFELEASQKGLQIEVIAPHPMRVQGDALRLTQVITNLLNNAIKFTEHGSITLRASEGPGGKQLEVQDSGIGIPPERLSEIFNPFVQIDNPLQQRYTGAGLGLAISRELCQKMGFLLKVESQPGQGTLFTIALESNKA